MEHSNMSALLAHAEITILFLFLYGGLAILIRFGHLSRYL